MDPTVAAEVALTLSFVVFGVAGWRLMPWIRALPTATALTLLLWPHAFRHIALQIFSAQRAGFNVSDATRDQIAYGDVLGMLLAIVAIFLFYRGWPGARLVAWAFVVETVLDFANALTASLREQTLGVANGLTWLILTFYVPLLWVTLILVVWQLLSRRGEASSSPGG